MTARLMQGIFVSAFLIYGSIQDIRTHTMPDWVWMGVAGASLLLFQPANLPAMLLGAAAVLLIEVPMAVMLKDRAMGGADIKLSAAGAFLLGWQRGLFALILGLALSVVVMTAVRKIRHEKEDKAFPLVPFLAAGILAVFLTG